MIAEQRVTTVHGTPTTFYDILRCPEFEKSDVSSLENGTIGATTLHSAAVAEIIEKLGLKDFMVQKLLRKQDRTIECIYISYRNSSSR